LSITKVFPCVYRRPDVTVSESEVIIVSRSTLDMVNVINRSTSPTVNVVRRSKENDLRPCRCRTHSGRAFTSDVLS
jgi:hypothetical protein